MFAGRPHQAAGDSGRRWMITPRAPCTGTEPGLQVDSSVAFATTPVTPIVEVLDDGLAHAP